MRRTNEKHRSHLKLAKKTYAAPQRIAQTKTGYTREHIRRWRLVAETRCGTYSEPPVRVSLGHESGIFRAPKASRGCLKSALEVGNQAKPAQDGPGRSLSKTEGNSF
jgi:hypothetical protein